MKQFEVKQYKTKHLQRLGIIALTLLLVLALSGCASLVPNKQPQTPDTPPGTDEKVIIEASGSYVGRIDTYSIEIIVDGKEQAFRLEEILEEFETLELQTGQLVQIKYYQNENGQLILEELVPDPSVTTGLDEIQAFGAFVGRIDSNSIEIAVDSTAQPFWLSEKVKSDPSFATLTEGTEIQFNYYVDEYGRSVITSLSVR